MFFKKSLLLDPIQQPLSCRLFPRYRSTSEIVSQSCPTLCDPMDCSPQAPLSMEFSRQEYWNGLPFPSPGEKEVRK